MSELEGFVFAVWVELLVRDQTFILCLKAALTFKGRRRNIRDVDIANSEGLLSTASRGLLCVSLVPSKGRDIKIVTNVTIGVGGSYAEPDKGYITPDNATLLPVPLRKRKANWSCQGVGMDIPLSSGDSERER